MEISDLVVEFVVVDSDSALVSASVDVLIAPSTVVGTSAITAVLTQPNGFDSLNFVFASIDGNGSDFGSSVPGGRIDSNPVILQSNADRITFSAGLDSSDGCEIQASFSMTVLQ